MLSGIALALIFSSCVAALAFLAPLLLGPLILKSKSRSKMFLTVILGFPAGAFLGNALINLIPEVFQSLQIETEQEKKIKTLKFSLMVVFGIMVFTCVEKLIRQCGGNHSHGMEEDAQEHTHQHSKANNSKSTKRKRKRRKKKQKYHKLENENESIEIQEDQKKEENPQIELQKVVKVTESISVIEPEQKKRPEGYLNLIANCVHVTLEGLAIGVIFAKDNSSMQISFAFAVLSHVIPQEIGDTSLLLYSGFTIKQASLYNGTVKCSSILGAMLGYWIQNDDNMQHILAFVIGNFLYLSCVDLLPMIVHQKNNKMFFGQAICFLLGVTAISVIHVILF